MSFIFSPKCWNPKCRTSFFWCFSFIQQFLLWYVLTCLLILLLWSEFMSFPIWTAWKRYIHRNMESTVWAASPWGCDTHPMENHICVLRMDLTWHTAAQSSSLLGMSSGPLFQHQACSLILSFLLPNIRLSQKMLLKLCLSLFL